MEMKIQLTFSDGRKRTYHIKPATELNEIDPNKEVEFIFYLNGFKIYTGFSDGIVDEEGDFGIKAPNSTHIAAFSVKRLMGWRYKSKKNNLTTKE